ncbi:hypothetical protein ZHAS_00001377 [Anopheles sinensis]|uniref:Uncharacterized protein n=1 Tax=Anopheles sinensis TaxID=74873 RepID=A0A084VB92_ANOSI|nr:hypothetical protein ZHAS_00001377 [Anopheles sinensis]
MSLTAKKPPILGPGGGLWVRRYGGGGNASGSGGGYDSRTSSRYESDSRYSRHDGCNDSYKRNNSSKLVLRYGGGGNASGSGGGYDSRNSSRYESDSRYSRHDGCNDSYKRNNSSKYEVSSSLPSDE